MMKVFERVKKQKIRGMVDIDAMQFGFVPGKSTMDAMFIALQLFAFVDLEKASDSVPRKVIKLNMRKLGVNKWLIKAVMAMHWNSTS